MLFVKVDVDDNPGLAQQLEVSGIPAMVRFDMGQETSRLIGYRPESEILRFAAPSG